MQRDDADLPGAEPSEATDPWAPLPMVRTRRGGRPRVVASFSDDRVDAAASDGVPGPADDGPRVTDSRG
ncbi:hypothetical protein CCE01nite_30030 [Cellulomonas cellasea]|uniref:Uncharacterized protein n=1 Tax=Cellulomonas cellasea TaxID=43670 RepID=A0A4Y3L029_9CELL|nr:hypothetical protein CCE01nite_30030 [Cellulomonas cellasea]